MPYTITAAAHQRYIDEQAESDERIEAGQRQLAEDLFDAYWQNDDPMSDIRLEVEDLMTDPERATRIKEKASDPNITMRDLVDEIKGHVFEVCEEIAKRYDTVWDLEERANRDWGV